LSSALATTLRYAPSDCFETFPTPKILSNETIKELKESGEKYDTHRKELMNYLNLGLTKVYNLFHKKNLSTDDLINETKKNEEFCKKGLELILQLRDLHKKMDLIVLNAYGWTDINLRHDIYDLEYLPENDRVRYTIHPDARKEVLKRLLELNHTLYEEEIKQGLHKEEDVAKFYEQKGIPVPAEVIAIIGVAKKEKKAKEYKSSRSQSGSKKSTANEGESVYKQPGLFGEENFF
jgi:hypothetical protein